MRRFLAVLGVVLVAVIAAAVALAPAQIGKRANPVVNPPSDPVPPEARALHERLFVADLHADSLLWKRNLVERGSWGHVDLPRLLDGNVALQAFTIVSKTPRNMNIESNDASTDDITLLALLQLWPPRTWTSLLERSLYQAEKLHRFAAASGGRLSVLRSRSDLERYLERRASEPALTAGILGIEGAQVLEGNASHVDTVFDAGFRMMAPTHFFDNEVGGSAHGMEKGGLTAMGRKVIRRMEQKRMLVDLAHASPRLIDDVLAVATRPVVVSHTGVRGTCDNRRNLSDGHVAGIANTGGVIGIGFWDTAVCGTDARAIARAIRHVADLVGADHAGLGSDFDGAVRVPFDASGLVRITAALLEEGFTEEEVAKIMGGNVLRLLRETLPE